VGAEATRIGVFERGPATSPLARSGVAAGLVESSRWAANLAVVLRCGRLCRVSFHVYLATFSEMTVVRQANSSEMTVVWREPDRLPVAYIRVLLVVGSPPRIANSLSLPLRNRSLLSSLSPFAALARSVFLPASRA
jgi:hypothetical protein